MDEMANGNAKTIYAEGIMTTWNPTSSYFEVSWSLNLDANTTHLQRIQKYSNLRSKVVKVLHNCQTFPSPPCFFFFFFFFIIFRIAFYIALIEY